jgi:hypothetical protein
MPYTQTSSDIYNLVYNARDFDELKKIAMTEENDAFLYARIFAQTAGLTADTPSDLWFTGGIRTRPSAATTMTITPANANDTAAGTGARYLYLAGLDANYDRQTEVIALAGTTPVVTTSSWIALNSARVVAAGTGTTNAGNIVIKTTTGDYTQMTIPASHAITSASHFTIPAGYTCFSLRATFSASRASGSGTKRGEISQRVYVPSVGVFYDTITYGLSNDGGPIDSAAVVPAQTPEKSTLWFTVTAETTGLVVSCSQELLLIKGDFNRITNI